MKRLISIIICIALVPSNMDFGLLRFTCNDEGLDSRVRGNDKKPALRSMATRNRPDFDLETTGRVMSGLPPTHIRYHDKRCSEGTLFLGISPGHLSDSIVRGYFFHSGAERTRSTSYLGNEASEGYQESEFWKADSAIVLFNSSIFNAMLRRGTAGIERLGTYNYPFISEGLMLDEVDRVLVNQQTWQRYQRILEDENAKGHDALLKEKLLEYGESGILDKFVVIEPSHRVDGEEGDPLEVGVYEYLEKEGIGGAEYISLPKDSSAIELESGLDRRCRNLNSIRGILGDWDFLVSEILGPMAEAIADKYNNGHALPELFVRRTMRYTHSNVYPNRRDIREVVDGGFSDKQLEQLGKLRQEGVDYVFVVVIDQNLDRSSSYIKDFRYRLVVVKNDPIALAWGIDMFLTGLDVHQGSSYGLYHNGRFIQKGKNNDILVLCQIRFDPDHEIVEYEQRGVYKGFKGHHFMSDEIFPRQLELLSKHVPGWGKMSLVAGRPILEYIYKRYFPKTARPVNPENGFTHNPQWGFAEWWQADIPANWHRPGVTADRTSSSGKRIEGPESIQGNGNIDILRRDIPLALLARGWQKTDGGILVPSGGVVSSAIEDGQLKEAVEKKARSVEIINNPDRFMYLGLSEQLDIINTLIELNGLSAGDSVDEVLLNPLIDILMRAKGRDPQKITMRRELSRLLLLEHKRQGRFSSQQLARLIRFIEERESRINSEVAIAGESMRLVFKGERDEISPDLSDLVIGEALSDLTALSDRSFMQLGSILAKQSRPYLEQGFAYLPEDMRFGIEIEVAALVRNDKGEWDEENNEEDDADNMKLRKALWRRLRPRRALDWTAKYDDDNNFEISSPLLSNTRESWFKLRIELETIRRIVMEEAQALGIERVSQGIHIHASMPDGDIVRTEAALSFIGKSCEKVWDSFGMTDSLEHVSFEYYALFGSADTEKCCTFIYNAHNKGFAFNALCHDGFGSANYARSVQDAIGIALNTLYAATTRPDLFNIASFGLPLINTAANSPRSMNILKHALGSLCRSNQAKALFLGILYGRGYFDEDREAASEKEQDGFVRNIYRTRGVGYYYDLHANNNGWQDSISLEDSIVLAIRGVLKRHRKYADKFAALSKITDIFSYAISSSPELAQRIYALEGMGRFRDKLMLLERVDVLGNYASEIKDATVSKSQRLLAINFDHKAIRIWNLRTGRRVRTFDIRPWPSRITNLIISEDDKNMIVCFKDGTLWIWDIVSGKYMRRLKGHKAPVNGVLRLDDHGNIVSWSQDRDLRIWSMSSGRCVRQLEGHKGAVIGAKVLGDRLVSWSVDGSIRIWGIDSGECIHVLEGHFNTVSGVLYWQKRDYLISYSGAVITMWDMKTGKCVKVHRSSHGGPIADVFLLRDGNTLLTFSQSNTVRRWNLSNLRHIRLEATLESNGSFFDLSKDENMFIAGHWNRSISLIDADTGVQVVGLRGHNDLAEHIEYLTDEKMIVSSQSCGPILLWQLTTLAEVIEKGQDFSRTSSAGKLKGSDIIATMQLESRYDIATTAKRALENFSTGKYLRSEGYSLIRVISDSHPLSVPAVDNVLRKGAMRVSDVRYPPEGIFFSKFFFTLHMDGRMDDYEKDESGVGTFILPNKIFNRALAEADARNKQNADSDEAVFHIDIPLDEFEYIIMNQTRKAYYDRLIESEALAIESYEVELRNVLLRLRDSGFYERIIGFSPAADIDVAESLEAFLKGLGVKVVGKHAHLDYVEKYRCSLEETIYWSLIEAGVDDKDLESMHAIVHRHILSNKSADSGTGIPPRSIAMATDCAA